MAVGKGPVGLDAGSATFNGTLDPSVCWGYNHNCDGTRPVAGENGCGWLIEGDYNDAVRRNMETYFQFVSADGLTARRAFFIQTNRTTNAVMGVNIASPMTILDSDCTTSLFTIGNTAFQILGNTPLKFMTNNVPAVQQENAAGNNIITLFQLNGSDQIVLGTNVLLGTGAGLLFPSAEATDLGTLSANRPQNINAKTRLNVGSTLTNSTVFNTGLSSTTEGVVMAADNAGAQTLNQLSMIWLTNGGTNVKFGSVFETTGAGARTQGFVIYTYSQFVTPNLHEAFRVTGLSNVILNQLGNGQSLTLAVLTELTTIAASPTTATAIQIPAGAIVVGVSVRVVTIIPTAATFTVTGTGSGTTFNTAAVSTAANTVNKGTAAGAFYNASAQTITFTPNLTPGAATGQVRVVIHYFLVTPPTS